MSGSLRFDVELTNACNARCIFCPHPRMARSVGYMASKTWERVIEQAKAAKILRLTIAGFGEPTLHPNFIEYLKWSRWQLPDQWIQLVTNASKLKLIDLDELANVGLTDIVISFNGYSPKHYERLMRGLSFEEVLQGIYLLKERLSSTRTEIRIRGIRFPPNQEGSRQKTVTFLRSLGLEPREDEFYPLHNRGGLLYSYHSRSKRVCREFVNTIAIGWDGTVPLCIGDMFHLKVIGNIHSDDIIEINSRCLEARLDEETQQRLCLRCDIADVFHPVFGSPVG